jgi:flagellar hook protein FlgE
MGFQQGLAGLHVAAKSLEVISNNIANTSVAGFKASVVQFGDLYSQSLTGASGAGVRVGLGSLVQSVSQQFSQGNITNTNNPMDIAIQGPGFFRLDDNGVITFSRNGQFHIEKDGSLTNASGDKVTGYSASSTGNINQTAPAVILIPPSPITPNTTTTMKLDVNLNSAAKMVDPAVFDAANPATYTNSTSGTVFDSIGGQHTVTMYFLKEGSTNSAAAAPSAFTAITAGDIIINGLPVGVVTAGLTAVKQGNAIAAAINASSIPGVTASADYLGKVSVRSTMNPLHIQLNGTATPALTGLNGASGSTSTDNTYTVDGKWTTFVTVDGALTSTASNGNVAAAPTSYATSITAGDIIINGLPVGVVTAGATLVAQGSAIAAAINLAAISGVTATSDAVGKVTVTSTSNPLHIQLTGTATAALTGLVGSSLTSLEGNYRSGSSTGVTFTNPSGTANSFGNGQIDFDPAGVITGLTSATPISLSIDLTAIGLAQNPIVSNSATTPLNFTLDLADATAFANPFSVTRLVQDGYSSGRLANFAIGDDGIITGHYSNGQTKALGQIVLANFDNVNGLTSDGANQWSETFASGAAIINNPGTGSVGNLQSAALEDSNVDLTSMLVEMITTQRIYQANAQTIKTQDQILQTMVNLR